MTGFLHLLVLTALVTVNEKGYPVYEAAPLPAYPETALSPARKAALAVDLPARLAADERRIEELEASVRDGRPFGTAGTVTAEHCANLRLQLGVSAP